MCGIVGALTQRDVTSILLAGQKRLEYRGYDSAGIAVMDQQQIQRLRCEGKINALENALRQNPIKGQIGIAHTRWATHGQPTERNAHPHMSQDKLAIVHNGIIENYETLRTLLLEHGYSFTSDTDTEVVVHLIDYYWQNAPHSSLIDILYQVSKKLDGAYALGIIHRDEPDKLYGIRQDSPLVIGIGVQEYFIASDMLALVPLTQQFIDLEEGDIAEITYTGVTVYDRQGQQVERPKALTQLTYQAVERGAHRHFMAKEIFEQPQAVYATLENRLQSQQVILETFDDQANQLLSKCRQVCLVACGTSYHAALVTSYWIEYWVGLPCRVEIASEFRYRTVVVPENTLFITISQSGETADTLAALRKAKPMNFLASLAICNVPGSSLVRESDYALMTYAGPEIGVASTKAFTTQLTTLLLLVAKLAQARRRSTASITEALVELPNALEKALQLNTEVRSLAEHFVDKNHTLFLGRGAQFPLALEGALKLKEISYIHAEAYPAGELKHGPLALVDRTMPVVVVAPNDHLIEKMRSNIKEVQARGGQLFAISEPNTLGGGDIHTLAMPSVPSLIIPIVYVVPLQLLAYHVAVLKGTDVDQPRNLAKSVTVE